MTLRLLFAGLFGILLFSLSAAAQVAEKPVARIILIGDAGSLTADLHHTVVEAVEKTEPMDKNTTVIFLGDNLYRFGLPFEELPNYTATKAVLDSQIHIADHGPGMTYFIPGNHDWMNGKPDGYNAALRQERYIESLNRKDVVFLPKDGCPGPDEVDLGNDVVLVILNSQWFVHKAAKPGIESDCPTKTQEEIYNELQDIVTRNYRKLVIFACHHPFKSNGVHGGYFTLKQHIFPFTDMKKNLYIPLPILGSIYPISRSVFGSPEDIAFPEYTNMITAVDRILKTHPNVIHVAGHEHALEWIADSSSNYIVSGAGCKTTRVSSSRKSKFVAASLGWVDLDIYKDKTVRATFRAASADSVGRVLYSDTVLNYSKLPPQPQPDTTRPLAEYGDSALVVASHQYDHASALRRFLDGNNYRDEWSQPVSMKVFHLSGEKGGLKITGAGGGFQTKSLHLVDSDGKRYNLRTIDKDPRRVLPQGLRETFAQDLVQDMISAAHPYAPLTVWPLANAANIITPKPEFFFVADDPALGFYRPLFGNKVCMLEPSDPTTDGTKSRSTAKVINKLIGQDDHFVEQKKVLQARLLDLMVGDWDRHLDQWRWGISDTGKGRLYYPIPRDRDQAFFNSDGLVMKFATQRRVPWMAGFKSDFHRFKWLNHQARNFDRIFLNELTEDDWRDGIKTFQTAETDDAVRDAVGAMPSAITGIRGALIDDKLRSRRDELMSNGMKYYRFLSRSVNVLGSNRPEVFDVKQTDSGILVQVHARNRSGDTSLLRYSRVFDPRVTKELRLYGFGGADRFSVDAAVRTDMRIRMIGGGGADTFDVAGKAHSHVYDVTTEPNQLLEHRHTKNEFSADPLVNDFRVQDFTYNYLRLPTIQLGYNPDDGPLAGLGLARRTYNFRKEPFESDNKLSALFAVQRHAFQIRYRGVFVHTLGPYDVLLDADLLRPALRNFYGFGNETKSDKDLSFYRARYNFLSADVLLQKRLFGIFRAGIGPVYNRYSNHEYSNEDKVLENPGFLGLDSASIYSHKEYLGGKIFTDVNNLNSELFPTRGISWRSELNALQPISNGAKAYTELHSDMDIYASLSNPAKLVAVLRFGGGHIFSENYEFFQAMSIGQSNYLRGFRRNRFSGRSMAYNSVELRAKLFDVKSYILPGAVGLVGFNDVARVWQDDESSRKWHDAFGGGFYYIPYNMFIISATAGFSPEETLFNVTIGTKLNLTF